MTVGSLFGIPPFVEILFINIFTILELSADPCVLYLFKDISAIFKSNSFLIESTFLKFIIALELIFKCGLSYICLASHVIALFPIIRCDLPELLLPALLFHICKNIALNFIELAIGYLACFYYPYCYTPCIIFILTGTLKIIYAVYVLYIYTNAYNFLYNLNYKEKLRRRMSTGGFIHDEFKCCELYLKPDVRLV